MKNCNNFYSYKNGKMYSACIECFNKKVRCEFCNKELNKSYLGSHVKKQHTREATQHIKNQHYIQNDKHQEYSQLRAQEHSQLRAQLRTINNTRDDLLPTQLPAQLPTKLNDDANNNNECN